MEKKKPKDVIVALKILLDPLVPLVDTDVKD